MAFPTKSIDCSRLATGASPTVSFCLLFSSLGWPFDEGGVFRVVSDAVEISSKSWCVSHAHRTPTCSTRRDCSSHEEIGDLKQKAFIANVNLSTCTKKIA